MKAEFIKKDLAKLANKQKAKILSGFFKTGKGEYGEGDIFIGITVPDQRKIANRYIDIDLKEVKKLLDSKIHEHRLTALLILVEKFKRRRKHKLVTFYVKSLYRVNNWDLVDLSAHYILGEWIFIHPTKRHFDLLYKLARSKNVWHRRVAILSLFAFVRKGKTKEMIKMCQFLLNDPHELIHKAMGWMLREVGKKSPKELRGFLNRNITKIPRTTLRYAIERFPEEERKSYLSK